MPMWRYAVITLLREAERAGVLDTDTSRSALLRLLTAQYERWWNIDVKRFRSKKQFLGYAGRYASRPPIAQHRFRTVKSGLDEGHAHETHHRDHLHAG